MRRLIHLMLSPSCRLARLIVAEKRIACDPVPAEDARNPMPVFVDMDGTRCEGVWAILDHLESNFPDHPLAPEDAAERAGVAALAGLGDGAAARTGDPAHRL